MIPSFVQPFKTVLKQNEAALPQTRERLLIIMLYLIITLKKKVL